MAAEFTSAATLFSITAKHLQEHLFNKSNPGKMSRPVGEADRPMQSVSPIHIAACAQKEQSGSFSYFLHISVTTGMTMGRRRVWRQTVFETASWIASFRRLMSACVSASRPML
jgi:hypothetical protein